MGYRIKHRYRLKRQSHAIGRMNDSRTTPSAEQRENSNCVCRPRQTSGYLSAANGDSFSKTTAVYLSVARDGRDSSLKYTLLRLTC